MTTGSSDSSEADRRQKIARERIVSLRCVESVHLEPTTIHTGLHKPQDLISGPTYLSDSRSRRDGIGVNQRRPWLLSVVKHDGFLTDISAEGKAKPILILLSEGIGECGAGV